MLSPLKGAKPGGLPEHLACVTSPNLEVQSISGVAHILMQHLQAQGPPFPGAQRPRQLSSRPPSPHTPSGGQRCVCDFEVCCLSLGLRRPLHPKFLPRATRVVRKRPQGPRQSRRGFFLSFTRSPRCKTLVFHMSWEEPIIVTLHPDCNRRPQFLFVLRSKTDGRMHLNAPSSSAGRKHGTPKKNHAPRCKMQGPKSVKSQGQES